MTKPEEPNSAPPAKRPVLYYMMTQAEHVELMPRLRQFGESLLLAMGDRLEPHIPGFDREWMMSVGELAGRSLAFVAGIDPEEFGKRIAGHDVKVQIVPPLMPCPHCANRRVATNAKCGTCGGHRMIATIIPPEGRLVGDEELKPKLFLVDAGGRDLA